LQLHRFSFSLERTIARDFRKLTRENKTFTQINECDLWGSFINTFRCCHGKLPRPPEDLCTGARAKLAEFGSHAVDFDKRREEKLRVAKPELVAQIEFTEWTPDSHLRHSKFVGLREMLGRLFAKVNV